MKTIEQTLRQVIRESIEGPHSVLGKAAAALRREVDMGWVDPWDVDDVAAWLMKNPHLVPFPDEDEYSNAGEVMKVMRNDPWGDGSP